MVDPVSTGAALGAGLAVLGSKDLLNKLLGPTCDYLGEQTKDFVRKRHENVAKIFQVALRKLGNRIDAPGQVNPRVLKHVLDDGEFCEDSLVADYFGGILASSRTEDGRDDRGVTFAALVKEMSAYQIRLHYIFYRIVKQLFDGKGYNLQDGADQAKMKTFIPCSVFATAMDLSQTEDPDIIIPHCVLGLRRHALIGPRYVWTVGDPQHIRRFHKDAESDGLLLLPSGLGAELFLWVHGFSNVGPFALLNRQISLDDETVISIPDGATPARA